MPIPRLFNHIRDFLNILSEVSPGCPLTVMLSSRSSWFSYKPPLLQESVLDIPELVGWATQQLGELEYESSSRLVHLQRDILVFVCLLKKDDIFIDWSWWSIVGTIVLSNLWFAHGLSSNQIRTNDVRNVVLLVVDPSSIHHYIFWSGQCYHRVHMVGEVQWYEKFWRVGVEPLSSILSPPWFVLNIKLVLETL